MDTPKYGKVGEMSVIDENGSTMRESTNFNSGVEMYPKRRDFEFRYRCDKTDIATISSVVEDLLSDDAKLDASIRFETRNAGGQKRHYVVACYTKLVY